MENVCVSINNPMFFEVLLHLLAHDFASRTMKIEFHSMHGTSEIMRFSSPIIRIGSLFFPFIFIDFQWKSLLIAWFLLSLK